MFTIFVYGSLQSVEVLKRVIDKGEEKEMIPAVLKDYKRVAVKGERYPAIYSIPNDQVDGKLIKGISLEDLNKLDVFEGDEYERIKVTMSYNNAYGDTLKEEVYTYLWCGKMDRLSDLPWSLENFEKFDLVTFLRIECSR